MPFNPTDVARLGHRYQVIVANSALSREVTANRVQRFEPAISTNLETYYELGNVDPVGYASEAPEFRITFEENVHASALDLLLAGKGISDTAWNLANYINNGNFTVYLLERTNDTSTTIAGELFFNGGVVTEINWSWRVGQPITAAYTIIARFGGHYKAANAVHNAWQSGNTVSPGGIKAKDARLFLGSTAAGSRMYRLQGFTLRSTFPSTVVREIGNRQLVGTLVSPPETRLDLEFAAADHQPDDVLFTLQSSSYYDYTNPLELSSNAIRVYDPTAAEATTVLRAWALEKLVPGDASPVMAQVRGMATKRYSMVVPRVTTAGTAGVLMYVGDIV